MNVKDLCKHWMHSHEEDTEDETVYRPASYEFPPARGRTGFDLKPDGSLTEHGIGPTDQRTQMAAKWTLSGDALQVGTRVMKVVSLAPHRLVVRKS